jgi:hypothetical protein
MKIVFALAFGFAMMAVAAAEQPPFADIHLHFNWDQREIISAKEVIARLQSNNVRLAVVSSTPSELALELANEDVDWVIPLFSPYITPQSRHTWFVEDAVLAAAREGLAQKRYHGVGELHLWSGMRPKYDNKILQGLLALAEQHDVPFLIHTEASDHRFLEPICQSRPKVRFLWAHAGGKLSVQSVEQLMIACPNVWVELSARDPWRYNSLVDEQNRLPSSWRALLTRYPDRFMTGTDPVWSVRKGQRWDEADDGWDHYDELLDFHRHWLRQLPPEVEQKIRLDNALAFFNRKN